ncbi:MAG: hypothetical protein RML46_02435 [Anaerolineae bacterium]|nr:hypothetical protein [Anaerolineae bacterium]
MERKMMCTIHLAPTYHTPKGAGIIRAFGVLSLIKPCRVKVLNWCLPHPLGSPLCLLAPLGERGRKNGVLRRPLDAAKPLLFPPEVWLFKGVAEKYPKVAFIGLKRIKIKYFSLRRQSRCNENNIFYLVAGAATGYAEAPKVKRPKLRGRGEVPMIPGIYGPEWRSLSEAPALSRVGSRAVGFLCDAGGNALETYNKEEPAGRPGHRTGGGPGAVG